jgi:hypothetical protein
LIICIHFVMNFLCSGRATPTTTSMTCWRRTFRALIIGSRICGMLTCFDI